MGRTGKGRKVAIPVHIMSKGPTNMLMRDSISPRNRADTRTRTTPTMTGTRMSKARNGRASKVVRKYGS